MSISDELGQLGELHQRGVLSDDEFARAKARVLQASEPPRRETPPTNAINRLRRDPDDRWLGGVCGGVARVTGIAAWVWRLVFVLGVLFAGCGALLYILLWIFVPRQELLLPAPGNGLHAG